MHKLFVTHVSSMNVYCTCFRARGSAIMAKIAKWWEQCQNDWCFPTALTNIMICRLVNIYTMYPSVFLPTPAQALKKDLWDIFIRHVFNWITFFKVHTVAQLKVLEVWWSLSTCLNYKETPNKKSSFEWLHWAPSEYEDIDLFHAMSYQITEPVMY